MLLDRLSRRFEAALRDDLAQAMLDMVASWEITGEVPPPGALRDRLEQTYRALAIASVVTFGSRLVDQGKAAGLDLEYKDFAQSMVEMALRYVGLEAIRRRITAVAETTRAQIVSMVDRGYQAGLGQRGVAQLIRDAVPQISDARAGLIARTETHGAANFGANEAAKTLGVQYKREWLSAEDSRTRPTHRAADGQIVGKDEPFRVGGVSLDYPGDPSGAPQESINCRCSVAFVIDLDV